MTRARVTARVLLAAAAVTAMGAALAAPASAHTHQLYTVVQPAGPTTASISTLDRVSGAVTPLGAPITDDVIVLGGIEIAAEQGWGIGFQGPPGTGRQVLFPFDHTTGATGPAIPLTLAGADLIIDVSGLDTLADGRLVTSVVWGTTGASGVTRSAIASIDTATGVLTPIVELSAPFGTINAIATDPAGATYTFSSDGSGNGAYYSRLDIAGGVPGPIVQFTDPSFGSTTILGADFDTDGTLYFNSGSPFGADFELSTLPEPSTWPTAPRTALTEVPTNYPGSAYAAGALTFDAPAPAPKPALASTGVELAPLWWVIGGVAVVGGIVAVIVTSRRKRT